MRAPNGGKGAGLRISGQANGLKQGRNRWMAAFRQEHNGLICGHEHLLRVEIWHNKGGGKRMVIEHLLGYRKIIGLKTDALFPLNGKLFIADIGNIHGVKLCQRVIAGDKQPPQVSKGSITASEMVLSLKS